MNRGSLRAGSMTNMLEPGTLFSVHRPFTTFISVHKTIITDVNKGTIGVVLKFISKLNSFDNIRGFGGTEVLSPCRGSAAVVPCFESDAPANQSVPLNPRVSVLLSDGRICVPKESYILDCCSVIST